MPAALFAENRCVTACQSRGGNAVLRVILTGYLVSIALAGSTVYAATAKEVQKLLAQLKDKDISERQTALRQLAKLGPEAAEAVPVLVAALTDKNKEIRQIVT